MEKELEVKERLLGAEEFLSFEEEALNGLPEVPAVRESFEALHTLYGLLNEEGTEPLPLQELYKRAEENSKDWSKRLMRTTHYLLSYTNIYRQVYDKAKEELAWAMMQHRVTLEENIKTLDERYG